MGCKHNDTDHRPGAIDVAPETEALLPGSAHPFCSALESWYRWQKHAATDADQGSYQANRRQTRRTKPQQPPQNKQAHKGRNTSDPRCIAQRETPPRIDGPKHHNRGHLQQPEQPNEHAKERTMRSNDFGFHRAEQVIIQVWITSLLSKCPASRDEGFVFIKAVLALAAVLVKQIPAIC
jgi:hypothetical protein